MELSNKNKIDEYYEALIHRDQNFEQQFFVGVRTTGIFCVATCPAKKPLKENVQFFSSLKSVLNAGYFPCKRCKPIENFAGGDQNIYSAMSLSLKMPKEKLQDYVLEQHHIEPNKLRTWFVKHYDYTFQDVQRICRINQSIYELKHSSKQRLENKKLGFSYLQKNKSISSEHTLLLNEFDTPIGRMIVCSTQNGICLLEFKDRRMLETELSDLQRIFKTNIIFGTNQHITQIIQEIKEYFNKQRTTFDVALDAPASEFRKRVWSGLRKIPHGTTIDYSTLAHNIDHPTATRAVASANGANRISILIPCHRVINKNGELGGYGGGIERKKWLLEHEASFK